MNGARREKLWLLALLLSFGVFGFWFVLYLVSWDAEWGYVFLGHLAIRGEIRLFQDEMLGERLPLPFYVMGASQLIVGRSLLAARLCSLGLAVILVGLGFALGRSLGGSTCGFLAALFLATNGMLVGYYAAASYFAFCALLVVGGLLAIAAGRPPWGPLIGMGCFTALALSRPHLAVMGPVVLAYLLLQREERRERLALILVAAMPPLVFLAWTSEHLKMLAYVPAVSRWVEPLGYRSIFALGAQVMFPEPHWTDHIVIFAKRYAFWLAATGAVVGGWFVSRLRGTDIRWIRPPGIIVFIGCLALYTLAWQVAILRRYPGSVPGWAATFAPLWAVVLAYGASVLIRPAMALPLVRVVVVAVLLAVFAVSPARSRHPSMPLVPPEVTTTAALARDAAVIRSVVPPSERVFLVGASMAPYLAGISPYLQQVIYPWTFVPSEDDYAVSRSGVWGRRQVETWLSGDAPYAIIAPVVLQEWFGTVDDYKPLVSRIETLLNQHFTLVATHGGGSREGAFQIYRRKSVATGK